MVPGTWPEQAFKRGYTIVCRRFTVETVLLNNNSTLLGVAKQRGLEVSKVSYYTYTVLRYVVIHEYVDMCSLRLNLIN